MKQADSLRIELPAWVRNFRQQLPECLSGPEERMSVAISLSRQNVVERTGGPFGAVVVAQDSGQVIALGVNRVEPAHCSSAHAEIVALSLAQQTLASWNLDDGGLGPVELVTSCEPCAMCLGAIPWSGVRSVLCGASKADAEAAGFDEGDRPEAWADKLAARGISVTTGVLRSEAAEVLDRYARSGQTIYSP
ncbi:nucleoside deaminase [Wenzhouxiangella marina]|uniref:CMP/dCMP deaminase zinc-binding n=1 Tax=Wenzhouxiangella marina TaxID=1579979 RepID=A0A0K0XWL9_9GAMM|nr:nucleoside deaminase [Wenzhouxiangella marina]AKS42027.1 CMP/dCMP deaminase zinc-binding [Wenzhouxiangella marina]MBB6086205.1 tRNA(Arg) A34 adenosine deaminase TadA [Wenzhouxiangella marina]